MIVCFWGITCYTDSRQSIDNHPCDGPKRISLGLGLCGPVKRQEGRIRGGIFGGSSASITLEVVHFLCLMIERDLRSVDCFERWEKIDKEMYQRSESGRRFTEPDVCRIQFLNRMICMEQIRKFNRWGVQQKMGSNGRVGRNSLLDRTLLVLSIDKRCIDYITTMYLHIVKRSHCGRNLIADYTK